MFQSLSPESLDAVSLLDFAFNPRNIESTSYVCMQLSISAWVRVTVVGSSGGSIHDFLSSFPWVAYLRLRQRESVSFREELEMEPFSLDPC